MVDAATRIQALQRGIRNRPLKKNKKYYVNHTNIYKRGVLVICIDPDNNNYRKYGYIINNKNAPYRYSVEFLGSKHGVYSMTQYQITPVFLFESTSIPKKEWMISLPDSDSLEGKYEPESPDPSFSLGEMVYIPHLGEGASGVIIRINHNPEEDTYMIRLMSDDRNIVELGADQLRKFN